MEMPLRIATEKYFSRDVEPIATVAVENYPSGETGARTIPGTALPCRLAS